MPVTAMTLSRYRCFRDPATLSMGRLSLVYGKNSSGKSALIRLPKLLASSLVHGVSLNLDHPAVGGAAFNELVWDHQADLLELGFVDEDGQRWSWALEWWEASGDPVVRHFDAPGLGHLTWTPASRDEDAERGTYAAEDGSTRVIRWEGLFPVEGLDLDTGPLRRFRERVSWLTTSRVAPSREGQSRGLRPKESPRGGEWTESIALRDAELRQRVSSWYEEHTADKLVVSPIEQRVRLRLQPRRTAAPDRTFNDVGEGLQQVYPVLVELEHLRDRGGLLCIEEPEAHLHPSLQRALAARIVDVLVQRPDARILMETHSEVFLYEALLYAVDTLHGQVSLSWVRSTPQDGASVEQIELDDSGRPRSESLRESFKDLGILRREVIEARRQHAG